MPLTAVWMTDGVKTQWQRFLEWVRGKVGNPLDKGQIRWLVSGTQNGLLCGAKWAKSALLPRNRGLPPLRFHGQPWVPLAPC